MKILFTIRASTPGIILLANPQTTRPIVFPIPTIDTRNMQEDSGIPNVFALSENKLEIKLLQNKIRIH